MKKEVKTSIDGLEAGMFVSRLDRPWVKTPFDLQGVVVRNTDDIERLRKYCNYVYVDVEQGVSPQPRFWILDETPSVVLDRNPDPFHNAEKKNSDEVAEFATLRKITYETSTRFEGEVGVAEQVHEKIGDHFHQILGDLKRGKALDLDTVKEGVTDMVESIIRNPSAMMWVVHIRRLDDYTYTRSLGSSVWCATFGRHLGMEERDIESLALGGLLLDLGKSMLPHDLLTKPGALTPDERNKMDTHVDLGIRVLAKTASLGSAEKQKLPIDVLQMIATHHERSDGSGYPQGLENSAIPLFGRIAGIVDSFDAMTSRRPYISEGPKSPHEAINELYEVRGSLFQTELVEQFIQTVGVYPTGSLVELNTGEVGAVVAINGLRRLRPSVMLLLDENKQPISPFRYMNLSKMGDDILVLHGLPSGAFDINMEELFL
ncbi:MAG: HD domain-containing phosphohydrolase [Sedimenticola sp.]